MSRGGRQAAAWVEAAWRRGARFDAWTEHFREQAWRDAATEVGLDPAVVAQTSYDTSYVMPWEHISTGVSTRFLAHERKKAAAERTTPDCTFERCAACGACPGLGVDNQLAQPRIASGSNAHADEADEGAAASVGVAGASGQAEAGETTVVAAGQDIAAANKVASAVVADNDVVVSAVGGGAAADAPSVVGASSDAAPAGASAAERGEE